MATLDYLRPVQRNQRSMLLLWRQISRHQQQKQQQRQQPKAEADTSRRIRFHGKINDKRYAIAVFYDTPI